MISLPCFSDLPLRRGAVVRALSERIQHSCNWVIVVLLHPVNVCGEQCVWVLAIMDDLSN